MKTTKIALGLGLLTLFGSGAALAAEMKPGLWEITSTMELPGMPFQPPPTTVTHCYTPQEVQNDRSVVPQQQGNCKVTEMKAGGNKITWQVVCSGEQSGKGSGEMIFQGNSAYQGTMRFTTEGMTMTSRYQGKRIGECK